MYVLYSVADTEKTQGGGAKYIFYRNKKIVKSHANFKEVLFKLIVHIYRTITSYDIKELQLWFSSLNDEFPTPILPGKLAPNWGGGAPICAAFIK